EALLKTTQMAFDAAHLALALQ
ncbi:MAG: hypothetical protein RL543_491, partial [Pseudomonadota bacterium]